MTDCTDVWGKPVTDDVVEEMMLTLPEEETALETVTAIMMEDPKIFEANQQVAIALLVVAGRMDQRFDGLVDVIKNESAETRAAAVSAAIEALRQREAELASKGQAVAEPAEMPPPGRKFRAWWVAVPAVLLVAGVVCVCAGLGVM